jgi:hypothetical protein
LPFRFDLHDFHPSRERAPHSAMLLDLHNLKYEPLPLMTLPICHRCVVFFNTLRASTRLCSIGNIEQ